MDNWQDEVKELIDFGISGGNTKGFNGFQKTYFWTNENINAYLNLVKRGYKDNALSVMASGDHLFNLLNIGINDIDTFDINSLTEYYVLGIKRAMILKCNYEEFLVTIIRLGNIKASNEEIYEIILGLMPYMDKKYREFWQFIIDYSHKIYKEKPDGINLIKVLFLNSGFIYNMDMMNGYLSNCDNYEKVRNALGNVNINYFNLDILKESYKLKRSYDLILLSNILDYAGSIWGYNWTIQDLNSFIDLLKPFIRKEGILFLKYIIYFCDRARMSISNPFAETNIQINELKDKEIVLVPSPLYSNVEDGIIMQRF